MKKLNDRQGQSLVEVIVALGLISLVLVTLIAAITFSLASVQLSRNKTQSSKLGQEAIDWVRQQRDKTSWSAFSAHANTTPVTYCLNDNIATLTGFPAATACGETDYSLTGGYKRELTMSFVSGDTNSINATVTLAWLQGNKTQTSALNTKLTNWYAPPGGPTPTPSASPAVTPSPSPSPSPSPTPTPLPCPNGGYYFCSSFGCKCVHAECRYISGSYCWSPGQCISGTGNYCVYVDGDSPDTCTNLLNLCSYYY